MSAPASLKGVGVLVTRPREQVEALVSQIQALSGTAVMLPGLEIEAPGDIHALSAQIGRLRDFDLIIFVSPTAVERAWPYILARHGDWPHGFALAAIGRGSLRMLAQFGARHVLVPEDGADSESLLARHELQVMQGRRVLIFRGEGGREQLAETLRQRGAVVEYAECYRRVKPKIDPAPVLSLWADGAIQAVTVTSTEILENLFDLLGEAGAKRLRSTPMFVIHERIASAARTLGVEAVHVASPGDQGLMQAITTHFSKP